MRLNISQYSQEKKSLFNKVAGLNAQRIYLFQISVVLHQRSQENTLNIIFDCHEDVPILRSTSWFVVPGTARIKLLGKYFGRHLQDIPRRTFRGRLKDFMGSSVGCLKHYCFFLNLVQYSEACLEPSKASMEEFFCENSF